MNVRTYQVNWKGTVYGRSTVTANSKKEAKKKADIEEDADFEVVGGVKYIEKV